MDSCPAQADLVPGPLLVAAWRRLDMLPNPNTPLWAAHWIVGGWDGPAVVELAMASSQDPVEQLIDPALAECGFDDSTVSNRRCRRVAFSAAATAFLCGLIDAGQLAHDYSTIMVNGDGWVDDDGETMLLPLYEADDDWDFHNVPRRDIEALVRNIGSAAQVGDI